MEVLVIGGTRFFGIPMVEALLRQGHEVTLATRGLTGDAFGERVHRLKLDLYREQSVRSTLGGRCYDVVIDKMGYGSNEIRWILESLSCDRFIHMSTAGVYRLDHFDISEDEFDGSRGELIWCRRGDVPYDDAKRNAERALCQIYPERNWVCVRAPFVMGENDYTRRLYFYVEHILKGRDMVIDNPDARFCVAERDELGVFMAFMATNHLTGPVNACADGVISVGEIIGYVEKKTGCAARLSRSGDPAPYNGTADNSLNTARAQEAGFIFRNVHSWIYSLLDVYMDEVNNQNV